MDRLHSDGASNGHGQVIHKLFNFLGCEKSKSFRLHPQGDGLSESYVKFLRSIIQKHVDKYGSNWDMFMQSAAFAVRSSIKDSIGCTPVEVIFGEPLCRPIDLTSDSQTNCTKRPFNVRQAHQFAKSLKSNLMRLQKLFTKDSQRDVNECQRGISQCFQPRWRDIG